MIINNKIIKVITSFLLHICSPFSESMIINFGSHILKVI